MNFNELLRVKRKEKKLTQDELAKLLNIARISYVRYEKGDRYPPYDILKKMTEILDISFDNVVNNEYKGELINTSQVATLPIKFLGNASCGEGIYNFLDNELFDIPISWVISDINDYYLVRAVGDSMIGANIQDGSILVVKHQNTLENGQIGVFTLNDEQYIKKIKIYENHIELVSANNKYDNITVTNNDNFIINGLVLKEITTLEKEI